MFCFNTFVIIWLCSSPVATSAPLQCHVLSTVLSLLSESEKDVGPSHVRLSSPADGHVDGRNAGCRSHDYDYLRGGRFIWRLSLGAVMYWTGICLWEKTHGNRMILCLGHTHRIKPSPEYFSLTVVTVEKVKIEVLQVNYYVIKNDKADTYSKKPVHSLNLESCFPLKYSLSFESFHHLLRKIRDSLAATFDCVHQLNANFVCLALSTGGFMRATYTAHVVFLAHTLCKIVYFNQNKIVAFRILKLEAEGGSSFRGTGKKNTVKIYKEANHHPGICGSDVFVKSTLTHDFLT